MAERLVNFLWMADGSGVQSLEDKVNNGHVEHLAESGNENDQLNSFLAF